MVIHSHLCCCYNLYKEEMREKYKTVKENLGEGISVARLT